MKGQFSLRSFAIVFTLLSALPAWSQDAEPLRLGRIATDDARILNLADKKGISVAAPSRGTLVAVFGEERTGWLSIEIPAGYAVWMSGRYLKSTDQPDVFEVSANAVNIRPGPSSDVTNFPLPQRLKAGDRVRVIELFDAAKPLAETWARIWSPPGVRAWIAADAVEDLDVAEDGAALWNAALALVVDRPRNGVGTESALAGTAPDDVAKRELGEARAMLETEVKQGAPDFASVRSAVEAVLVKTPSGPTAVEARETLRRIDALEEAVSLRAELLRERERRAQRAMNAQKEVWEASRARDPLGEVFVSRGVLIRKQESDGSRRFYLRFGGETVCEVFCSTGRYDLGLFAGFEVGLQGASNMPADGSGVASIETSRIEIIKRR